MSGGGAKGDDDGPAPLALDVDDDGLALDFSGPDLALPDETPAPEPKPREAALRRASAKLAPVHDAWSRDRMRRGSDVHAIPAADGGYEDAELEAEEEDEAEEKIEERDSIVPGAPEETGALRLVDRRRRSSPGLDLAQEMADRYALDDFTGALGVAELLLGHDPKHAEARRTARASRSKLEQIYSARLGTLSRVPKVSVPDQDVRWLGLDHRAGFLLSRVDGRHTVEEIVDMSGMQRLEALKLLAELLAAGAIRF